MKTNKVSGSSVQAHKLQSLDKSVTLVIAIHIANSMVARTYSRDDVLRRTAYECGVHGLSCDIIDTVYDAAHDLYRELMEDSKHE